MDINNFAIDRVINGTMFSKTNGELLWRVTQVTNPSLNCATETTDIVDAIGTPIMTLDRAKTAEFSGENSLFDLGLAAAQLGSTKEIMSSEKKQIVPINEEFVLGEDATTITLSKTPVGAIPFIYLIKADSSVAEKYKKGSEANATDFTHADKQTSIKLPTGLKAGMKICVPYSYEREDGVSVTNYGNKFPKAGRFLLDVLGYDICNQEHIVHALVEFHNAKLTGDVDFNFTTEGTHPFTIKCLQDYCDANKRLFTIYVIDE
jgi:hypothetical protein